MNQPERFAGEPLETVPDDSIAVFFAYGDAEPWMVEAVFGKIEHKQVITHANLAAQHVSELLIFGQSQFFRKSEYG